MIEHLLGKIHQGDNLVELKKLPDNCINACITDPPYGLKFMGQHWDYDVPKIDIWREVLRVLKPGAHLLSFFGTRTYHRGVIAIEDAGFEIRDQIGWAYGSGFPKSHNISKAIDKELGAKRETVKTPMGKTGNKYAKGLGDGRPWMKEAAEKGYHEHEGDKPATATATAWQGWGTALKPAWEPICVARKPISEDTIAANVLKWGTGAINIDGCRVGSEARHNPSCKTDGGPAQVLTVGRETVGRWPANLIHDGSEEVLDGFPNTGASKSANRGLQHSGRHGGLADLGGNIKDGTDTIRGHDDLGGSAARFFYTAKASKWDRNEDVFDGSYTIKYNIPKDLGGISCNVVNMVLVQLLKKGISDSEVLKWHTAENGASIMGQCPSGSLSTILTAINKITKSEILNLLTHSLIRESIQGANSYPANGGNPAENAENLRKLQQIITSENQAGLVRGVNLVALQMLSVISVKENWRQTSNTHSTVKPTDLMQYLCRLVTPPDGIILDPYAGSGSTGKAALLECFRFIGFEREAEYCKIANARIAFIKGQLKLF